MSLGLAHSFDVRRVQLDRLASNGFAELGNCVRLRQHDADATGERIDRVDVPVLGCFLRAMNALARAGGDAPSPVRA